MAEVERDWKDVIVGGLLNKIYYRSGDGVTVITNCYIVFCAVVTLS
jgi:hypothetical protein